MPEKNYRTLVIGSYLPEILEAVRTHDVVILKAPTGSGKTMGLPPAVADLGSSILMAIPTVLAVTKAYDGLPLFTDANIGMSVKGEVNYDTNDKIVLATTGHVKNRLLKSIRYGVCTPMKWPDVLAIDEAHMGQLDQIIAIQAWKYCYERGVRVPRLLIISATIDPNIYPGAYPVSIESVGYPIEEFYHHRDFNPGDPEILVDTAEVVSKYHYSSLKYDILVFVTGEGQINGLTAVLSKLDKVKVLPLSSANTDDKLATGRKIEGFRRIILATNAAEASVTIEDIGLVVDLLQANINEALTSGATSIKPMNISKSSAQQRRGRVGRVGPGILYRMCTRQFYESLNEHITPEPERIRLERPLLEIYNSGVDAELLFKGRELRHLSSSVDVLKRHRLIALTPIQKIIKEVDGEATETVLPLDASSPEEKHFREGFFTTPKGRFVFNTKLEVKIGSMLWLWFNSSAAPGNDQTGKPREGGMAVDLYAGVVLASMLNVYNVGFAQNPQRPPGASYKEYSTLVAKNREKYHRRFTGRTDIDSFYKIWNAFIHEVPMFVDPATGKAVRKEEDIRIWMKLNSMNAKILDAYNTAVQLMVMFENDYGFKLHHHTLDIDNTMAVARVFIGLTWFDSIAVKTISREQMKSNQVKGGGKKKLSDFKSVKQIYQIVSSGLRVELDQMNSLGLLGTFDPAIIVPFFIVQKEVKDKASPIILSTVTVDLQPGVVAAVAGKKTVIPLLPGERSVEDYLKAVTPGNTGELDPDTQTLTP